MIDYLYATVVQKSNGYIVAECNDIGYRLLVSQITSSNIVLDEKQMIYTYMIVKEDELSLIGFTTTVERDMFELLISVSKIGAKTALSILSTYTPSQIAGFVKSSDIVALCKISGLGKKTSERMVLELKDKVDLFLDSSADFGENINDIQMSNMDVLEEVIQALTMLGFTKRESEMAASKAYESNKEADIQTLIKSSLMLLKK